LRKGFTLVELIAYTVVVVAMVFFANKYFSSAPSKEAVTIAKEIDNR